MGLGYKIESCETVCLSGVVNVCAGTIFEYAISLVPTLKRMTLYNLYRVTHMRKMIRSRLIRERLNETDDVFLFQVTLVTNLYFIEKSFVPYK